MQHAHDASEHLRRDILVYLRVLLVIDCLARPKDSINKAHNLILVVFALVKALLCAVIHSFFVRRRLWENRLRCINFLLSLEGDIAEQDADVLALKHPVIVKVVPIGIA